MSDRVGSADPVSREKRVELFGEEKVQHTEWWAGEMQRVRDVSEEIVEMVQEREDMQLAKRGKTVGRDGVHEFRMTVKIAGEPWEDADAE